MGQNIVGVVEKTVTAENQWTDWLGMSSNVAVVTVEGSGTATVKLQRRRVKKDGTASSNTTEQTLTGTGAFIVEDSAKCDYRVGVATGGFTSGTLDVSIEMTR